MQIQVFWYATLGRLANIYRRFGKAYSTLGFKQLRLPESQDLGPTLLRILLSDCKIGIAKP
jgi:hypothetical protein